MRQRPLAAARLLVPLGLSLLACAKTAPAVPDAPPPAARLQFNPVALQQTDLDKRQVWVSDGFTLDGVTHDLFYEVLLRTGQEIDGHTFGALLDQDGSIIRSEDGSPWICDGTHAAGAGPDHSTLLQKDGQLFLVSQMECPVGGAYVAPVSQAANGDLRVTGLDHVDMSAVGGGYVHCAGMPTAWGTHLGSEEYEPNARLRDATTGRIDDWYDPIAGFYGGDLTKAQPYDYGWVTEISLQNAEGDTQIVKHRALGRFSHELAYVLPDQRTVYLSDDGTNTGFYLFVADTPGDLSAGHLWAATWQQRAGEAGRAKGGHADLAWVPLGHADDATISTALTPDLRFEDLFRAADPVDTPDGPSCPDGFASVNTGPGRAVHECLAVVPGQEVLASRLETRRYAATLGATTEFRKGEGITFDPDRNRLYVSWSEIAYGMEDHGKRGTPSDQYDGGGPNHIRVPHNPCGGVYQGPLAGGVRDTAGTLIPTDRVLTEVSGLRVGIPRTYDSPELAGNSCDVNDLANPDNLTYLPGHDVLIIGEDTSLHVNDAVWALDLTTQVLTRIAVGPYGSEMTSPYWYPDIGGHGYLMLVVQHPYGESDQDKARGPGDHASMVGVIGPFPPLTP